MRPGKGSFAEILGKVETTQMFTNRDRGREGRKEGRRREKEGRTTNDTKLPPEKQLNLF